MGQASLQYLGGTLGCTMPPCTALCLDWIGAPLTRRPLATPALPGLNCALMRPDTGAEELPALPWTQVTGGLWPSLGKERPQQQAHLTTSLRVLRTRAPLHPPQPPPQSARLWHTGCSQENQVGSNNDDNKQRHESQVTPFKLTHRLQERHLFKAAGW